MGNASSNEESEEAQIDPIRIIWDSMGNVKFVSKQEAEEKYDDSGRTAELDAILKAEWEDQQEEDKMIKSKAKEKLEKAAEFKKTLDQLRKDHRNKIDDAIKNRQDLPPPFVEPIIPDDVDETTWYVMSSAWVEAWLEYANGQKGLDKKNVRIIEAPYPGPCDNSVLLEWSVDEDIDSDDLNYSWKAKKNLTMASKTDIGDYRRISKRVWDAYKKLYPNSGPEIKMKYTTTAKYESAKLIYTGATDVKDWIITTPLPPPAGAKLKKKKKTKKAKEQKPSETKDSNVNDKKVNDMVYEKVNSLPGAAKSPIMELARLTSSGPDSDDDSIDDIILSGSKSNNKMTSSPPSSTNSKIAFQTIGKDSDDDDDDDEIVPRSLSIIPSLTATSKVNNSSSNSKANLPSILLKSKDSDDDSDEGFEIMKNNEKLNLGKLIPNQNKPVTKSAEKNIFSINNYTRNVAEPDSDDDDTVLDSKLNITPNKIKLNNTTSLAIRLTDDIAPVEVKKRIDDGDDFNEKRSIMSLLTSKNN